MTEHIAGVERRPVEPDAEHEALADALSAAGYPPATEHGEITATTVVEDVDGVPAYADHRRVGITVGNCPPVPAAEAERHARGECACRPPQPGYRVVGSQADE